MTTIDFHRPQSLTAVVLQLGLVAGGARLITQEGQSVAIERACLDTDLLQTDHGKLDWERACGYTHFQLKDALQEIRREANGELVLSAEVMTAYTAEDLREARTLVSRHAFSIDLSTLGDGSPAGNAALLHLCGARPLPQRGLTFGCKDWEKIARRAFQATGAFSELHRLALQLQETLDGQARSAGLTLPGGLMPVARLFRTLETMRHPFDDPSAGHGYVDLVHYEHAAMTACRRRLQSFKALVDSPWPLMPADMLHAHAVRQHPEFVRHVLSERGYLKLPDYRAGTKPVWSDVLYGEMRPSEAHEWMASAAMEKAMQSRRRATTAIKLLMRAADALADHVTPHIATVRAALHRHGIDDLRIVRERHGLSARWVMEVEGFRLAAPLEHEVSPWACQELIAFLQDMTDRLSESRAQGEADPYRVFMSSFWQSSAT